MVLVFMKSKILNAGLILTSLMGYLEWGTENRMYLFQVEWVLFSKLFTDPLSVIHPFTLLPLTGQLLLLFSLFQKYPGKKITFTGLSCLSVLLLFIFFIGLISFKFKIITSVIPFLITGVITIQHHLKNDSGSNFPPAPKTP